MSAPFADHVADYAQAGWSCILPVPPREKYPPPPGFTGAAGRDTDPRQLVEWVGDRPGHSIALRMPDGVIGIDVDHYVKGGSQKRGADTLAACVERWGPLPPTWTSTAREPGGPSRIYFFRVPAGRYVSRLGSDVEIIQRTHRYAVVWPSVHHETGTTYTWYDPAGRPASGPPKPDELTELPTSWVTGLHEGGQTSAPSAEAFMAERPRVDLGARIRDGIEPGEQDDELARLAMSLRARGFTREEAGAVWWTVVRQSAEDPARPWTERDFDRHWGSADRKVSASWTSSDRDVGDIDISIDRPPLEVTNDRPPLEVTNSALCAEWLRANLGTGPLAGVFNRDGRMVHTPRVGEDGYLPLTKRDDDKRDDDGPAQVRPIDAGGIVARVQYTYRCFKRVGKPPTPKPALFPREAAQIPVAAVDMLPNLRVLRGVTHTPLVRRDGTVLTEPGYDDATRLLHLPAPGLVVPPVPDSPTAADVAGAVELLDLLLRDFPFVTSHDRANYLAALLTPLLRELVPPPYKLVAIGAHQSGSGKSLLATVARTLHGGVFRAEMPEDEAELRKQISSILDVTTAPIVQFDNVSGVLRSSTMSGLLTSDRWDDRRLGNMSMLSRRNDRLWMITGNNVLLGGDLVRRTLWCTIDPAMPHPEKRTGFAIANLKQFVAEHRGELVHALLVLIRAWVVAGRPIAQECGSDDFARWLEAVGGILAHAGVPGVVGHEDSARQVTGSDDDEWEAFMAAAHAVFGDESWTARELLEKVDTRIYESAPGMLEHPQQAQWRASHPVQLDDLPAPLVEKINRAGSATAAVKTLGRWLHNREGRFAGVYCARSTSDGHAKIRRWRVEVAGFAGSAGFGNITNARDFRTNRDIGASSYLGSTGQDPADPADPAEACTCGGSALGLHFPSCPATRASAS